MSHDPHVEQSQRKPAAAAGGDRSAAGEQSLDLIAGIEAQLTSLKAARSEQSRAEAAILERERRLAEREEQAKAGQAEIERRAAELAERQEALQSETGALEARAAELDKVRKDLEAARAGVEETRAKAERETQQRTKEIEEARAAAERELRQKEAELEEATRSLDAAIKHASDRAGSLAEERESFELERSKWQAKASEREKALAQMRAELEAAQKTVTGQKGDASAREKELSARARKLEEEAAELRTSMDRLEAERAQLKSAAKSAGEASRALEEAQSERNALANKLAEQEREVESLRKQIAAAGEGADARLKALADDLKARSQALADAEKKIAALGERAAAAERDGGSDSKRLSQEIEKRDRAIEALTQRLRKAQAENEQLLEAATNPAPDGAGGAAIGFRNAAQMERRRRRLLRYKELLQQQSKKILQARQAITKRQEEYERLLQKRSELSDAKLALERLSARVNRGAARNKASIAVLSLTLALAIVAGLSWTISERVFPATYLVSATLQAQPEGQDLTPEQFDAWRNTMAQMVGDPRLSEVAADRFKRRGIAELSSPADVTDRMSHELDVSPSGLNEVVVTLRGVGADRTRRILDTYLAAMISAANESRDLRLDRAMTALAAPPKADDDPVEQPHLMYAAMGFGGASGFVMLFGLITWARLSHAKRRFEAEEPALDALDESHWPPTGPGARVENPWA